MSGDGFTFEPESYTYGASRIHDAGGDLDQAGDGYTAVQRRASGQLRRWAPTVPAAETLDQVEAKLAEATRLGAADLHHTGDKLLTSRETMLGAEGQNVSLAERAGQALRADDRAGLDGETGIMAGQPSRIDRLLNAGTPAEDSNATVDQEASQQTNQEINQALDRVNPKFNPTQSAYSENCTSVVQANELRRRGLDVRAGPLEKPARTDEGGTGGRPLSAITGPWGGKFTPATKAEIEDAFKDPGSRGVVYIAWKTGGAHVFNVENVGGKVRFVDGQPTPPCRTPRTTSAWATAPRTCGWTTARHRRRMLFGRTWKTAAEDRTEDHDCHLRAGTRPRAGPLRARLAARHLLPR